MKWASESEKARVTPERLSCDYLCAYPNGGQTETIPDLHRLELSYEMARVSSRHTPVLTRRRPDHGGGASAGEGQVLAQGSSTYRRNRNELVASR